MRRGSRSDSRRCKTTSRCRSRSPISRAASPTASGCASSSGASSSRGCSPNSTTRDAARRAAPRAAAATIAAIATDVVRDAAALDATRRARSRSATRVVVVPVGAGENALHEAPVGFAFALAPGRAAYLPFGHAGLASHPQLTREAVDRVRRAAARCGVAGAAPRPRRCSRCWATAAASQRPRLGTSRSPASCSIRRRRAASSRSPRSISVARVRTWEEFAGRGAKAVSRDGSADRDDGGRGRAKWPSAVADLAPLLLERLVRDGIDALFRDVEMPLTAVLARMERVGVRVDEAALRALSREYERELLRARDGDPRTGGRAVPDRVAEAAPGRALREAEAAGGAQDQDRLLDRRVRARAAGVAAPAAGAHPGVPAARQAEEHLRRRVAAARRCEERSHPSHVPPDRRRDGTALGVEPERAEHPDPQRGRRADPRGLHRARGSAVALGRLLAGGAAHPRALLTRREPARGVPRRARTSTAARQRACSASRPRR